MTMMTAIVLALSWALITVQLGPLVASGAVVAILLGMALAVKLG